MSMKTTAVAFAALLTHASYAQAQACEAAEFGGVEVDPPVLENALGGGLATDGGLALVTGNSIEGYLGAPAYLIERDGADWQTIATLRPEGIGDGDRLGSAVALDGDLAVIAMPNHGPGGQIHVFRNNDSGWVEEALVVSSDAGNPDYWRFGAFVAISDGRIAAIAKGTGDNPAAAYLFEYDGDEWAESAAIHGLEHSVSKLAFHGDLVMVYAWLDLFPSASLEIYREVAGAWSLEETLAATEGPPVNCSARGSFGYDGDRLAVSFQSCSILIYRHEGNTWQVDEEVVLEEWGWATDIVIDGDTMARGGKGVHFYLHNDAGYQLVAFLDNTHRTDQDCSVYGCGFAVNFPHRLGLVGDAILGSTYLNEGLSSRATGLWSYHGITDCDGDGGLDLCQIIDGILEDEDGDGGADICDICAGDVNGDGRVNFSDLLAVLSNWGPCGTCPEDLDEDGVVGFDDLLVVLSSWGKCG